MELILKSLIAILFSLAAFAKFSGKTKSTFDKAGYSPMFMYGLAFAELVGVIGLFTQFEFYAILGLIAIMFGAFFTLFRQNAKPQQYLMALITTGLLVAFYWIKYF
jgi:hypothetical protein